MNTPTAANELAPSSPPRRPWRRLHASTWAALAVVGVGLVLIIVPAYDPRYSSQSPLLLRELRELPLRHGWPWHFAYRSMPIPTNLSGMVSPPHDGYAPWTRSESWALTTGATRWDAWSLAGDAAVALAILATVAVGFEAWRRRRHCVWQFSLRDLFVLTLLVATALSWWKCEDIRLHRERALAERLGLCDMFVAEYHGPEWLARLVGDRYLSVFDTVVGVQLFGDNPPDASMIVKDEDLRESLDEIADTWPNLMYLAINLRSDLDERVASLGRLKRLICLEVWCNHFTDGACRHLGRFATLANLELRVNELPSAGLAPLASLPRLESLVVDCPSLTGDDLVPLARLPRLAGLFVYSRLDDQDLERLHCFKQLQMLQLWVPTATPESTARLRAAIPNCDCTITQL